MGWFGKGIMDGDEPLEWKDEFLAVLEVPADTDYFEPDNRLKSLIESRQTLLMKKVVSASGENYRRIGTQVLGVLIMAQGASIRSDLRRNILDSLKSDEWSNTDLERKIYVGEMIDIFESYEPGKPTAYYKDWKELYGMSDEDLDMPSLSWRVLNLAMGQVAEHLKDKPWFNGVRFAVNMAGYRMLLMLDPEHANKPDEALRDEDVPARVFDIPISFCPNEQVTVYDRETVIGE